MTSVVSSLRSSVEDRFEEMLTASVPTLAYYRNDRQVLDGLELDFWFPVLKVAVEINGPVHYFPVYGVSFLAGIRARDARKRLLCKLANIKLYVIQAGDCNPEKYIPRFERVLRDLRELYF